MDFGRYGFLMEGNSHVELPRHLSDEERDSIVRKYKKIESYIEECADCDACYDSLQRWMDMESFAKYYLLHCDCLLKAYPWKIHYFMQRVR